MQTSNFLELPKRARYYQGLLDIDTLEKSRDYKELKESFIVFICTKDPFGFGIPCYTVKQVCKEEKKASEKINDRTHKIYYNAESWEKSENAEVRSFLKFLSTQSAETDLTNAIESAVFVSKGRETWRKNFMTLFEKLDEAKTIGLNEGIAIGEERGRNEGNIIGEERGREVGSLQKAYETAKTALQMDLDFEQISMLTGLSIEQLEEIAERIE